MLCEKCNLNDATIHLTEIIKNVKTEIHLCDYCAREIGLKSNVANFSISVTDIVKDINDNVQFKRSNLTKVCPNCGLSLTEIKKTHNVTCPTCFKTFNEDFDEILINNQNSSVHSGKVPHNYVDLTNGITDLPSADESYNINNKSESNVYILYQKLDEAVDEERYEEAAVIRDKIKEKEKILKGI